METGRREHRIEFMPEVAQHVRAIARRSHGEIREAISRALRFEPDVPSRNRKRLREPCAFGPAWELRCGTGNHFRVFYRVDDDGKVVRILAIGEKRGERLWVGGEEFEL